MKKSTHVLSSARQISDFTTVTEFPHEEQEIPLFHPITARELLHWSYKYTDTWESDWILKLKYNEEAQQVVLFAFYSDFLNIKKNGCISLSMGFFFLNGFPKAFAKSQFQYYDWGTKKKLRIFDVCIIWTASPLFFIVWFIWRIHTRLKSVNCAAQPRRAAVDHNAHLSHCTFICCPLCVL